MRTQKAASIAFQKGLGKIVGDTLTQKHDMERKKKKRRSRLSTTATFALASRTMPALHIHKAAYT